MEDFAQKLRLRSHFVAPYAPQPSLRPPSPNSKSQESEALGEEIFARGVSTKRVPHEPKVPVALSCESGLFERLDMPLANTPSYASALYRPRI